VFRLVIGLNWDIAISSCLMFRSIILNDFNETRST
jgi:hypothetical protein